MERTVCNPIEFFVDQICVTTFLETAERRALLELSSAEVKLRPGQDVATFPDGYEPIRIVKAGVVCHFLQMRDGLRQYAAIYLPGDACNLDSLVGHSSTKALSCLGSATIVEVDRKDLQRVCTEYPGIAEAFWRSCVGELARANDLIASLARLPAEARIARFIIEMARRTGSLFHPVCAFGFPLSQAQLGEAVGLTPVHTNRMIRRLTEASLISLSRNLLTITDVEGLVRMAKIYNSPTQNIQPPMRISECVASLRQHRDQVGKGVDFH